MNLIDCLRDQTSIAPATDFYGKQDKHYNDDYEIRFASDKYYRLNADDAVIAAKGINNCLHIVTFRLSTSATSLDQTTRGELLPHKNIVLINTKTDSAMDLAIYVNGAPTSANAKYYAFYVYASWYLDHMAVKFNTEP